MAHNGTEAHEDERSPEEREVKGSNPFGATWAKKVRSTFTGFRAKVFYQQDDTSDEKAGKCALPNHHWGHMYQGGESSSQEDCGEFNSHCLHAINIALWCNWQHP